MHLITQVTGSQNCLIKILILTNANTVVSTYKQFFFFLYFVSHLLDRDRQRESAWVRACMHAPSLGSCVGNYHPLGTWKQFTGN